jgi:hypothetical protein
MLKMCRDVKVLCGSSDLKYCKPPGLNLLFHILDSPASILSPIFHFYLSFEDFTEQAGY